MSSFNVGRSAAKWLGCGVMAVTIAGCASDKTPAHDASAESTPDSTATAQNDADTTISISEDFRRECQLPNAPQEAPHFEYADATLHARGLGAIGGQLL